jgi:hypothetical protein
MRRVFIRPDINTLTIPGTVHAQNDAGRTWFIMTFARA